MKSKIPPAVQIILGELLDSLQSTLGSQLLGYYLYGSLVWGEFNEKTSDIDLLAVVSHDIDEPTLLRLEAMHAQFAKRNPAWNDRIETQYFTPDGLHDFREKETSMANISPGEPIHLIMAGDQWLVNWYFVQDYGLTLYGPPPETFIPHIEKAEFIRACRDHAAEWYDYVHGTLHSRAYQGYAILTLCRALYTLTNGEQVSKLKAARWAADGLLHEYADLIEAAMRWREEPLPEGMRDEDTYPVTEAFVRDISKRITEKFADI